MQKYIIKLEIQRKKAIRHIKNLKYNSHTSEHFQQLQYLKLPDLITFNQAVFIRNYANKKLPFSFNNMLSSIPDNARRTRDDDFDYSPSPINQADLHYFPTQQLIYKWNSLPLLLKSVSKLSEFRSDLKSHFTSKYKTLCNRNNCYSCSRP